MATGSSGVAGFVSAEDHGILMLDAGPVSFVESLVNGAGDGASLLRVRFLMPALADPELGYDAVADGLKRLCEEVALPLVDRAAPPAQIVVSLSSAPIAFGESNPDVRQIFEVFDVDFVPENGACIWGDL